jgi:hypothetical protein
MMFFALWFVRSSKIFFFVLVCFQASGVPRPENLDSDEKDALFDLDTQITIIELFN